MSTTRQVDMPELTEEQFRVHRAREALHRDGASPAGALDLLAALVEDRTWERVCDGKGVSFAGRFREFVATRTFGLGFEPGELPKVANLRHPHESQRDVAARMATMRMAVDVLLKEEIPRARAARQKGSERTTLRSETADRHLARLKRDDPALAEKVVNGEVSAYAAARSKGWKPPRIQVTTPERTAAHLRKHMSPDQLIELARLLTEES